MVGMTGTGKSALGNSILALSPSWVAKLIDGLWKQVKRPFLAMGLGESVTVNCKREDAMVLGQNIAVVDTPGFFDTKRPPAETYEELTKGMLLISPGPHAILLVIRIGRRTDEVIRGVELVKKILGEESVDYMVIVFTGMDSLDNDGLTIDHFLRTLDKPLKQLLEACNNRFVAVNNTAKPISEENKKQIQTLIDMTKGIADKNNGRCYTNTMLQEAKVLMDEEERKLRDEEKFEREKKQTEKKKTKDQGATFASLRKGGKEWQEQFDKANEYFRNIQTADVVKKNQAATNAAGSSAGASIAKGKFAIAVLQR